MRTATAGRSRRAWPRPRGCGPRAEPAKNSHNGPVARARAAHQDAGRAREAEREGPSARCYMPDSGEKPAASGEFLLEYLAQAMLIHAECAAKSGRKKYGAALCFRASAAALGPGGEGAERGRSFESRFQGAAGPRRRGSGTVGGFRLVDGHTAEAGARGPQARAKTGRDAPARTTHTPAHAQDGADTRDAGDDRAGAGRRRGRVGSVSLCPCTSSAAVGRSPAGRSEDPNVADIWVVDGR